MKIAGIEIHSAKDFFTAIGKSFGMQVETEKAAGARKNENVSNNVDVTEVQTRDVKPTLNTSVVLNPENDEGLDVTGQTSTILNEDLKSESASLSSAEIKTLQEKHNPSADEQEMKIYNSSDMQRYTQDEIINLMKDDAMGHDIADGKFTLAEAMPQTTESATSPQMTRLFSQDHINMQAKKYNPYGSYKPEDFSGLKMDEIKTKMTMDKQEVIDKFQLRLDELKKIHNPNGHVKYEAEDLIKYDEENIISLMQDDQRIGL